MSQHNSCVFQSSKYYRKAFANPFDIVQPLGFKFLSKQQIFKPILKKGSLQIKVLPDRPIIKALSMKKTQNSRLPLFLKVQQASRKNSYISTSSLAILSKTDQQMIQDLATKFIPQMKIQQKKYLQFVCCLHSLNLDLLFAIKDYSLSKFLIYYDGHNSFAVSHIFKLMEAQFIEYQIHAILSNQINQPPRHFSAIKKPQINDLEAVEKYISSINELGNQLDKMYHGVQFFIADVVAKQTIFDIQKQEVQNLQTLQFHLYVLTGILGDGQNAIVKLRSTFRHKTTDFLFLYKLAFNKISLIKPLGGNFLQQERYLICEGYCEDNGKDIHAYLKQNYNLLKQFDEDKLLVNPQAMFKEDFQTHVMSFNDNIISKGLKQLIDEYLKNTNLEVYPPKQALIQKLKQYNLNDYDQIIQQINRSFPQEKSRDEEKQEDLQDKPNEQEPSLSIFDLLKAKKQAPVRKKSPVKHQKTKIQEAEQIQKKMQQRYQLAQKKKEEQRQRKKEQSKKKKPQFQDDKY